MSSVKNILAGAALSFSALGFLGSAPAQAGVVVKSSGPSAETYPVGKKLDDAVDKLTHPNEGPLEKLGRKTDEALEDVKEALDDTSKRD